MSQRIHTCELLENSWGRKCENDHLRHIFKAKLPILKVMTISVGKMFANS